MLKIKTTAAAVIALVGSTAFAGTMGPICTPGNVTVPCERTAWDFGAQALYLQPVNSGSWAYNGIANSAAQNYRHYLSSNRDWGWGFKIEGSYHFSTGNDLDVNWYHLQKSRREYSSIFFVPAGGTTALQGDTHLYADPKWDAVNVEFGQHVDFGEFKDIRFHAGLEYARIARTARAQLLYTPYWLSTHNKFEGVGPRIGSDMQYNFGNGFAIYGNGAGSILVGDSRFHHIENSPLFTSASGLPFTTRGEHRTLVPELEAKLGAKYTYAMAQGDVTLDAGYMWVNYFNAQHASGGLDSLIQGTDSDFGVHGVYFGLKWVGNV